MYNVYTLGTLPFLSFVIKIFKAGEKGKILVGVTKQFCGPKP